MKAIHSLAVVAGIILLFGCSNVDSAPPSSCDADWRDPTGQANCPEGNPVSCNQATQCFNALAACEASGQCGTGGTPNVGDCVPNWVDPTGQISCPAGTPSSCDQATDCFSTVAECAASGQCS